MPKKIEIVGIAEIAERLERTRQCISNWRRRNPKFPKPLAELQMGPVWDMAQINAWLDSIRPGTPIVPVTRRKG